MPNLNLKIDMIQLDTTIWALSLHVREAPEELLNRNGIIEFQGTLSRAMSTNDLSYVKYLMVCFGCDN